MNKANRFLLCLVALSFSVLESGATDESGWRIYSEAPNGDVHFYDPLRIEMRADMLTVWTRIRYKRNVMAAASYQSLLEINCDARTERTLQRTFFSDRDWQQPAMKTDTKPKKKRPIRKGSAFARLADLLCNS